MARQIFADQLAEIDIHSSSSSPRILIDRKCSGIHFIPHPRPVSAVRLRKIVEN